MPLPLPPKPSVPNEGVADRVTRGAVDGICPLLPTPGVGVMAGDKAGQASLLTEKVL